MLRLLYVSISKLDTATALHEIEEMVKLAVVKNARLGINGALIYADGIFAQALEGEEARVDALMQDIFRDVRHRRVTVIRRESVTKPRFNQWNLAYSGESTYIGRSFKNLFSATGKEQAKEIDRIDYLMDNMVAS